MVYNPNQQTLDRAVGLALENEARLTVVDVVHDLVIMTAEGKDGFRERLFGSTSMHLMRECPCPVWVMKPTRRKRIERILAAVWR